MQTNVEWQNTDDWVSADSGERELEGELTKGYRKVWGSNGYVYYFNCHSVSQIYIYICEYIYI